MAMEESRVVDSNSSSANTSLESESSQDKTPTETCKNPQLHQEEREKKKGICSVCKSFSCKSKKKCRVSTILMKFGEPYKRH